MNGGRRQLAALVRSLSSVPIEPSPLVLASGLHFSLGRGCLPPEPAHGPTSRSRAGVHRATLTGDVRQIGIDIETLERVGDNASAEDEWLAPTERALVRAASRPILELTCHWVLKEAYGKALGVGLAMPLAELSFAETGGEIVLGGPAAPPRRDNWRFCLYRHETLVIGIAYRAGRQAVTPLAPFGRKPPMALLER